MQILYSKIFMEFDHIQNRDSFAGLIDKILNCKLKKFKIEQINN